MVLYGPATEDWTSGATPLPGEVEACVVGVREVGGRESLRGAAQNGIGAARQGGSPWFGEAAPFWSLPFYVAALLRDPLVLRSPPDAWFPPLAERVRSRSF